MKHLLQLWYKCRRGLARLLGFFTSAPGKSEDESAVANIPAPIESTGVRRRRQGSGREGAPACEVREEAAGYLKNGHDLTWKMFDALNERPVAPPDFPAADDLALDALAGTLTHTTASYKYFWLLALLEQLQRRGHDPEQPIAFRDLFATMLQQAQPFVFWFGLSLGASDKMKAHLLALKPHIRVGDFWRPDATELDGPVFRRIAEELAKFVPWRWPRAFVNEELADLPGDFNQKMTLALARRFQGERPPPYYISPRENGLVYMHPKWAEYFRDNAAVIENWCLRCFAQYLQVRNPHAPVSSPGGMNPPRGESDGRPG